jgi:hypothetical protein
LTLPVAGFYYGDANMAREGSKRQIAIDVMTANADKPMADVLPLIAEAAGLPNLSAARAYYKNLAENFGVPGKVESAPKAVKQPKAKVAKEPKAKAKAVSVATTRKARVIADVAATGKTADEVEAIRAANLAKIKAVHERMIARGDLPNTLNREIAIESEQPITIDEELEADRDYPQFLTRDQLDEVLGEL